MTCWAVVLAAGNSRRFGSPKLTAPLRGKPLLDHSLGVLAAATGKSLLGGTMVVHRPGDIEVMDRAATSGLIPVEAARSERGIGESLRAGFAALRAHPESERIEGALIVHGDQPLLRVEVIERILKQAADGEPLVVRPTYAEQPAVPGHPVWLARSVWALLDALAPDQGLASVIASHALPVVTVEVSGANPDVDTPDQLLALERRDA